MRVLIACEFSGVVRRAFREAGHEAWSCDLLPAEDGSPYHFRGDVRLHLSGGLYGVAWDLLIAHPPCTYLCNSGVRWLYGGKGTTPDPVRWQAMREGAALFAALLAAPVPRIAVENPIMHGHARALIGAAPTQIIQPWQYGHGRPARSDAPRARARGVVGGAGGVPADDCGHQESRAEGGGGEVGGRMSVRCRCIDCHSSFESGHKGAKRCFVCRKISARRQNVAWEKSHPRRFEGGDDISTEEIERKFLEAKAAIKRDRTLVPLDPWEQRQQPEYER